MSALALWLLAAMTAWAPLVPARLHGETLEHAQARYASIAGDVAAVALDDAEPPLEGGRARTALLLASIAFWESGFDARVDEGRCSPGTCDNGIAWSLWQLHDGGGITLTPLGWLYARNRSADWLLEHADAVIRGPQMIADRKLAIRVALHFARRSVRLWTQGAHAHQHATGWANAHPFGG